MSAIARFRMKRFVVFRLLDLFWQVLDNTEMTRVFPTTPNTKIIPKTMGMTIAAAFAEAADSSIFVPFRLLLSEI